MNKHTLTIDHPALVQAKAGFNALLQHTINKAITTGSMEGTVTLKLKFEITEEKDQGTGEIKKVPKIGFKSTATVPLKHECEGTVTEPCTIMVDPRSEGRYLLMDNQITIDELLEGDEEEDG